MLAWEELWWVIKFLISWNYNCLLRLRIIKLLLILGFIILLEIFSVVSLFALLINVIRRFSTLSRLNKLSLMNYLLVMLRSHALRHHLIKRYFILSLKVSWVILLPCIFLAIIFKVAFWLHTPITPSTKLRFYKLFRIHLPYFIVILTLLVHVSLVNYLLRRRLSNYTI